MATGAGKEKPNGDCGKDWRKWCRLCAKNDPEQNISIFERNQNNLFDATLTAAIGKYFWVNIKFDDHLSRDLCMHCHTLMTELIAFADRVNKVQAMYCVLENVAKSTFVDSFEVRRQYGLDDDNWQHIIRNGFETKEKDTSLDETEMSNEEIEQSGEEAIVETLDYFLSTEDQKPLPTSKSHNSIKKEDESFVLEDPTNLMGDFGEDGKEEQKIETLIETQKSDETDFEEYDLLETDTEFEVEFMNEIDHENVNENDNEEREMEMPLNNNNHKPMSEYKCYVCGKKYRNPSYFRKHIMQAHNQKYNSSYEEMQRESNNNSEEQYSSVLQDGDLSAGEDYPEDTKLMLIMSDDGSQSTDVDQKPPKHLKNHRKRGKSSRSPSYGSGSKKIKSESGNDDSGSFRYNCDICNRPYKSPGFYRKHMLEAHRIKASIVGVPCNYCDETFPTEKQLYAHTRRHLPSSEKQDFSCSHCEKKFTTSGALRQHINGIHFNEKPFICDECGKCLKTLAALNEHKLVHTDEKPVKCQICGKGFKNKARMKVHMDTHPSTGYQCSICNHKLNTRRTLKMHMLVHNDEKQYKCSFCPTEFKRSKALKNHLILHTGMRPFKCSYCDKTFSNGSNCRSHKKKVHPKELAEDEAKGIKRHDQESVPHLNQLRSGTHIKNVKDISRSRSGGLTPRMRALLIAAEKKEGGVDDNSENIEHREDSDTLESIDSFTVEGGDFETYHINEQDVQVAEDGHNIVAVQLQPVSNSEETDGTIIYEVVDAL